MPLKVETVSQTYCSYIKKITGFTAEELAELDALYYGEMVDKLLDTLNKRNGNLGDCWEHGYGFYHAWIADGAVFVEIGDSCE